MVTFREAIRALKRAYNGQRWKNTRATFALVWKLSAEKRSIWTRRHDHSQAGRKTQGAAVTLDKICSRLV